MTRTPVAALLLGAALACAPIAVAPGTASTASTSPSPTASSRSSVGFDGARAHDHLAYLADPARGGRFTGSAGYDVAAAYVADQLRAIGVEPLGDAGSYLQRFPARIVDLAATPALSRGGANARTWTHRVDFTESVGGRAGGGTATGPLAVVGGGATEDIGDLDLTGRIALVTGPTVNGFLDTLIARGITGVLVVGNTSLKYSYLAQFASQTVPALVVSERTADELLSPIGRTAAQVRDAARTHRSQPTAPSPAAAVGDTVTMSVPLTPLREVQAANVVGVLRATGPDAARAVLIGGHLDGVGTDPNGTVFPAANDNASGPSVMIEVARVLAAHASELRRSVVFVAFAGEEQGYLGSEAYIARMAATPGRVESLVAMLNLDVIGCCGTTLEASNESAALDDRLRTAATAGGVPFATSGPGGSDQQSFARRGVPAVLVLWSDYILHTTADTVDKVDVAHLQRAGDVIANVALDLARGAGP